MLSMFAVSIATACLSLAEPQEYDVIVAGGGPAGIGAGYMAAKRGAKTLVLEKSGRLGGMGVSALVSPFSVATESPIVNHIAGRIGFSHSVDFHMAFRRPVETADHVEERGFSGAGRPENGKVLPAAYIEIDSAQRMDFFRAHRIDFRHAARLHNDIFLSAHSSTLMASTGCFFAAM